MYIYRIKNNINNKSYIGQTVQKPSDRWRGHLKNDRKSAIYFSIKKYGKENFEFCVIDTADSLEELNKKEASYIEQYNTLAPNGYNLKLGGNNSKWSEFSKKRMSESRLGEGNPMFGKTFSHSEETKAKISSIKKGKKNPKLSKALKNNPSFIEAMKLVAMNRRSYSGFENPNSKKVEIKGQIFNTMIEASEKTGLSLYKIRKHYLKNLGE